MKLNYTYLRCAMAAAALPLILSSCGESKFKIKGSVYGADKELVVLAKSDFGGRWIVVDSTRTSSNGTFSISQPAPAAPDVFRIEIGDRFIYFPVDSTETITVETSLDKFGSEYTLSGSAKAELMEAFDKEVMAMPSAMTPDSLAAFKRRIFTKYLQNEPGSVVSYYILTKTTGNNSLFNPSADYKYFAAVATGFKHTRPNDPRVALLENTALKAIRDKNANRGIRLEIEGDEVSSIDIDLPDENGNNVKLSSILGKGKPVIVMFTALTHPNAPAVNAELSKLHSAGIADIYQVGIDPDQYAWRDAARNLSWTTVFDADGEYSKNLLRYNVSTIPTYFIYTGQGALKARASSIEELRKQL